MTLRSSFERHRTDVRSDFIRAQANELDAEQTRLARVAPNINGGLPRENESSFSFQLTNAHKPQWAGVPGWNTTVPPAPPGYVPPPPPQQQQVAPPAPTQATNYSNPIFPRQDIGMFLLCLHSILLICVGDDDGILPMDDAPPPPSGGGAQSSRGGSRAGSGAGSRGGSRGGAAESGRYRPGPPPMPGMVFVGVDREGEES